jgi:hypothetical protein
MGLMTDSLIIGLKEMSSLGRSSRNISTIRPQNTSQRYQRWHSCRRIPRHIDGPKGCRSFKICSLQVGGTRGGAEVNWISIPLYKDSDAIWMVGTTMGCMTQSLLSNPSGRKQLLFSDRAALVGPTLSQEAFDALELECQNVYLRGLSSKNVLEARSTHDVRICAES